MDVNLNYFFILNVRISHEKLIQPYIFYYDVNKKKDIFHYIITILVLYGAPEWIKIVTGSVDMCSVTIVALMSL